MMKILYKELKRLIAFILILSVLIVNKGFLTFIDSAKVYANGNDIEIKQEIGVGSPSIIAEESLELGQDEDSRLLGWTGGSNANGDNLVVSSEFEYAYLLHDGKEDKTKFYYTDDYFKNDSSIYNNHLSTMSIDLALSGVGNYIDEEKDKYANAKDVLSKAGFVNITPNDDFLRHPEENTMGSVCANKHIYLKDNVGNVQDYNLFAIVMRSANYNFEWISNFKVGESGDHQGFSESRDRVYDHFNTFYNDHKDDFGAIPVKIWIVGYSRGGGTANMLGGKVTDNCASFNTTKENIYCYTLGAPKAAFISNHTAPTLDSYTNIHNVLTNADLIQLFPPSGMGFGRYGVDHEIPVYVSDKVHDATDRAAKQQHNAQYMTKYNSMLTQLRQIDPTAFYQINNLEMYELTLLDTSTFKYMIYKRLGEDPFDTTSDEREYYQAIEFVKAAIDGTLMDLLNCNYAGTDYGTITGRDRYYQKYQAIISRLIKVAVSGNTSALAEKIKQNALDNLFTILPLIYILDKLVYCEGDPPDRTHFLVSDSEYWNVYEKLEPIYPALLDGVLDTDDYNFFITHHRDLTDFVLDFLNSDFRSSTLPKKSTIGTIAKNYLLIASEHLASLYVSWLQEEDDYFTNAPSNTLKYDGIKTLTFTDLSNSKVEVYNENNNKMCEYTIDASNNVTCNDFIGTEYAHIAKSYNPVGMELRLTSDKNYRAVITANDKSLGQVIYREYFLNDAEYYRKEMSLGEIYLKSDENIEISFHESSFEKVYSCYPSEYLKTFKAATFEKVTNHGVNLSYGYDYFTSASMPSIYKTIKLSADSLKEGVAGDYANFAGTNFEIQGSNLESVDLDSGPVYKKIDLLSKADAVLHVVNNVSNGFVGERTYNNYNNAVKTETNMNYNKANLYYMGRNAQYGVAHTLEVSEGTTGLMGSAIDIATSSNASENAISGLDLLSSTEKINIVIEEKQSSEKQESESLTETKNVEEEETTASKETEETSETSETIETTATSETAKETNETTETTESEEETTENEETEATEATEAAEATEATEATEVTEATEETTTVENTVGGFTNTEGEAFSIATESEADVRETGHNRLFGSTGRLFYVSVPYGLAKDASNVEKKYFNEGDIAKIYITKEDVGKKIKSISIYNGDALVETIDNVELNVAVDYTVGDFDARVVANFENKKYPVNFTTQAEGTFYYFNGQNYVEGVSGNEYEYGTKIRFTAPMMYDGREFYGWTLKDSTGRYLNQKGVDTPKIKNESTSMYSTYTLELKDYGIDILANYCYKAYTLTLQIDGSKGVASPSDAVIQYTNVDDFNNAKGNIEVISTGPKAFLCWSDGRVKYARLADYTWQYKSDVTLRAEFESDLPPSSGGGDSSGSRSSSSDSDSSGGAGPIPSTTVPQVTEIKTVSSSVPVSVDVAQSTWVYDPVSNKFKLNISVNNQTLPAVNGFYTINSIETIIVGVTASQVIVSDTYCFDSAGNMITGWLHTPDNKWYFFENAKNVKEGTMSTGWKEVQGAWYFFATDGSMLSNTMTPDGYMVGTDGKWIR